MVGTSFLIVRKLSTAVALIDRKNATITEFIAISGVNINRHANIIIEPII